MYLQKDYWLALNSFDAKWKYKQISINSMGIHSRQCCRRQQLFLRIWMSLNGISSKKVLSNHSRLGSKKHCSEFSRTQNFQIHQIIPKKCYSFEQFCDCKGGCLQNNEKKEEPLNFYTIENHSQISTLQNEIHPKIFHLDVVVFWRTVVGNGFLKRCKI